MERPKGSKALLCITLLTLAQLLTPGLAQAAPPPTAGNTTQLQPATVPYTAQQIRCFTTAAAASEEANTYYEVSALLGMASVYGNNSDMLAKLMAVPGASDLMELSLTTVNADYEKWVALTMEGCGMLELRDGSGIELTPDEVVAWLNSISTTDLLASMGFNMTRGLDDEALASTDFSAALTAAGMPAAVRRRLLFWKGLAAMASGAAVGFGSSMLAHMAGNAAQAMVVSALVLASAPASVTGFGGMLAYAAVSRLVKSKVTNEGQNIVGKFTDDPKVKDQFSRAMAFGSSVATSGIQNGMLSGKGVSLKVVRLAVKSELESKQAELIAEGKAALAEYAWAQANAQLPGVANLLLDLKNKVGAIQRLSATAADVSRSNWKTVAADVVSKAVEDAGLNPTDLLTDALAATFEPTPGVEPIEGAGGLTGDTTDLELPASVDGGTAIDGVADTWDILNTDPATDTQANGVSAPEDGIDGVNAGVDITTPTSNDATNDDDSQGDEPTSMPDDGDTADVDTSPSTPDDGSNGNDDGADVDTSPSTPDDGSSGNDDGADVNTSHSTPDDGSSGNDDSGDVDTSPSTPDDGNGSGDDGGEVDSSPSTPDDSYDGGDDSRQVDTSPTTPDDSGSTDDAGSATPDYYR